MMTMMTRSHTPSRLLCLLVTLLSLSLLLGLVHASPSAAAGDNDDDAIRSLISASIGSRSPSGAVFIFSKSYCPYCSRAKQIFQQHGVEFGVMELDQHENGSAIQATLAQMTGSRTVPSVWINGEYFGGSDATVAAFRSGDMQRTLARAGIQQAHSTAQDEKEEKQRRREL